MKVSPPPRPPRSSLRRFGDVVVSLAMVAVLIALYALVVSRGHLPL
jgi:hypothetical protein